MMIRVLSLGAGVQSSVLLLMSDCGELPPLEEAIFSDTQQEPQTVYDWLQILTFKLKRSRIVVRSKGDLGADSLVIKRSKKSGKLYQKNLIPWFVKNPDGSDGFMMRKCTSEYKIREVVKRQREIVGAKVLRSWRAAFRRGENPPPLLECWIGISLDEAKRAKPSREPWILNRFPLIELGMTREDCISWAEQHGFGKPPKSSCKFCPYHSDAEWFRLKRDEPEEFAKAVQFENAARKAAEEDEVTRGELFLHHARIPLYLVKFDPSDTAGYTCDGYCAT